MLVVAEIAMGGGGMEQDKRHNVQMDSAW